VVHLDLEQFDQLVLGDDATFGQLEVSVVLGPDGHLHHHLDQFPVEVADLAVGVSAVALDRDQGVEEEVDVHLVAEGFEDFSDVFVVDGFVRLAIGDQKGSPLSVSHSSLISLDGGFEGVETVVEVRSLVFPFELVNFFSQFVKVVTFINFDVVLDGISISHQRYSDLRTDGELFVDGFS